MLLDASAFRRLCQARALLSATGGRGPTIREVAQVVGISPFHFIRQFEAVFGATPHQLRIEARLERAKQLLALGEGSVTDVCLEVGFASLGSFSALFHRRIGEAPSRYQRRVRAMVSVPRTLPVEAFPGCLSLMRHLPPRAFRNSREA
ncbi:MAG: AraC family transcriptional regulator [Kofleriaceae bacterium]